MSSPLQRSGAIGSSSLDLAVLQGDGCLGGWEVIVELSYCSIPPNPNNGHVGSQWLCHRSLGSWWRIGGAWGWGCRKDMVCWQIWQAIDVKNGGVGVGGSVVFVGFGGSWKKTSFSISCFLCSLSLTSGMKDSHEFFSTKTNTKSFVGKYMFIEICGVCGWWLLVVLQIIVGIIEKFEEVWWFSGIESSHSGEILFWMVFTF